jgi:hypothetical protein
VSEVRGVGSSGDEDEAAPLVGSADLVRLYNTPLDIEPEVGKVAEDSVEAEPKVVRDVFKDRDSGSKYPKGTGNEGPEVPDISRSFPLAGGGERLAGVAAAHDVDGLDVLPPGGGEVTDVRCGRPAVGENLVRAGVDVGHPRGGAAEDLLDGHVEAAVAGAEGTDARGHRAVTASRSGHRTDFSARR